MSEAAAMNLAEHGCALLHSNFSPELLGEIKTTSFANDGAGERCLLDRLAVSEAALLLKNYLQKLRVLGPDAVAVQAIAFDKTAAVNWKVTWHQDLMFPFAAPVRHPGFTLASVKAGINYARPPCAVIERMLAARIHLDACDAENGPLRVVPGTHRHSIIPSGEIDAYIARGPESLCLADTGQVLLMRPLLLHASSPARQPRHRRVLHLVYYDGPALPEKWHRGL